VGYLTIEACVRHARRHRRTSRDGWHDATKFAAAIDAYERGDVDGARRAYLRDFLGPSIRPPLRAMTAPTFLAVVDRLGVRDEYEAVRALVGVG
jgi:hypothetical protein